MSERDPERIRHRELVFAPLHEDPHQARSALLLLNDLPGVVNLVLIDDLHLRVSYQLDTVSLRMIEDVLAELGFHLDNSLLSKLKRALYHYSEDVQRDNLGCAHGEHNCVQKVFVNRYQYCPTVAATTVPNTGADTSETSCAL